MIQEVIELVVDFLHDSQPSLKSCALVGKAWLPASQFHLFSYFALDGPESSARRVALERNAPHLLELVAHLAISLRKLRSRRLGEQSAVDASIKDGYAALERLARPLAGPESGRPGIGLLRLRKLSVLTLPPLARQFGILETLVALPQLAHIVVRPTEDSQLMFLLFRRRTADLGMLEVRYRGYDGEHWRGPGVRDTTKGSNSAEGRFAVKGLRVERLAQKLDDPTSPFDTSGLQSLELWDTYSLSTATIESVVVQITPRQTMPPLTHSADGRSDSLTFGRVAFNFPQLTDLTVALDNPTMVRGVPNLLTSLLERKTSLRRLAFVTGTDEFAAFAEEKLGWTGYVEWEKYPEKKALASSILKTKKFTPIPEFQFVPLPNTNPILIGYRWKEYHEALGLKSVVDFSWKSRSESLEEKPDLLHVLDFPVRNHGGSPDIAEDVFELEIGGLVNKSVNQMEVTVTLVLQCSGTRRIEQINEYPGDGEELINAPWGLIPTGTAVYRGVPLKKVLKIACGGVTDECKHLEFIGADTYFKKNNVFNYAVSVPYRKVRANEEVILAWEMNGKPLPKSHGAPLRVVVTGYIGARSCKWVYRINAIAEPSMGPVQAQEYLYYTSQIGKQNTKYSNGFSIQNMPVSSAIISPRDKQVIVHEGKITLKGWSYSGGGNWVERVEVSPDGGSVWYAVDPDDMTEKHYHAWRLWTIDVPVDAEGWLEFCVRSWDSSNNTEPTFVRSAWNWDLHVTSSCHRIKIYSVNKSRPATVRRLQELRGPWPGDRAALVAVGISAREYRGLFGCDEEAAEGAAGVEASNYHCIMKLNECVFLYTDLSLPTGDGVKNENHLKSLEKHTFALASRTNASLGPLANGYHSHQACNPLDTTPD
ncbi:Sulfite oxidase mitochondrial [Mycena chlorophos]|uniref:Sulfite oxidase mitochondrial n=1 Tax=Mycena chlorophos TaxID=658473 RepID=A0A8H6SJI2_MYCCL|nr:Sulfite oxidase mitochondrial [Mycena chlorophos]